jgi:hypothetical protein
MKNAMPKAPILSKPTIESALPGERVAMLPNRPLTAQRLGIDFAGSAAAPVGPGLDCKKRE